MKTTKNIFAILLILFSVCANAQLKVLSTGRTNIYNQTAIYSNSNTVNDLLDLVNQNPSISKGFDLIWGVYHQPQPNNPGLLTLQSVDGAYFTVRANGRVGIYNNNPSCALEIGTLGTNYEMKINGAIVLTSDERVKENIKDIDKSLDKLKLLKCVSYNFKGVTENARNNESSFANLGDENKLTFNPQNNKDSYGRNYYGFLAQDIQSLFPDLVYKDSTGMLGVDYIGMIPLLVNALNEQQITIANLETRLSRLEIGDNSVPKKLVQIQQPKKHYIRTKHSKPIQYTNNHRFLFTKFDYFCKYLYIRYEWRPAKKYIHFRKGKRNCNYTRIRI